MNRVRIIGPGRAGTSLATALSRAGWDVLPALGRADDVGGAATVARHLDALPADERPAYEAMARGAARLCP